jgi:RNAse (barnase) inhibitor barstar
MKNIVFDFAKIKNESQLNSYIVKSLDLPSIINGNYGYNLSAFKDTYSYLEESDFFELKNIDSVTDPTFRVCIESFIEILNDLKETNPNFNYNINYK